MPQHPLQQLVLRIRRSWNRRLALELLAWGIAGGLLTVLLAGSADYSFRSVDRGLRVLLSAALLGGFGWLGWALFRRWRRRRWSEFRASLGLQEAFPQLGDRLASSLEFLRQDESENLAGSVAMRRAVVLETTAAMEQLPVERVGGNPRLANALAAALVMTLLAAGVALWRPQDTLTAIARLAAPWGGHEWPRRHSLEFVNPPRLIARGQPFEVAIVDTQGEIPADTRIEYRYLLDGRRRHDTDLPQRVGDTLVARRDKIMRDFEFRATGGDHHSMPWHPIEVVDPPSLDTLEIVVHPPTYSGLAPSPLGGLSRVLAGSSLSLEGDSPAPLRAARLVVDGDEELPLELTSPTQVRLPAGVWRASLPAGAERLVQVDVRLTGTNDLQGTAAPQRFRVIADAPPEVGWREPAADLLVLPTAVIPVTADARDDLAIAKGELRIHVSRPTASGEESSGEEPGRAESTPMIIPLYSLEAPPPLATLPATGVRLDERQFHTELRLADHELQPGNVVTISVVATDFRGGEGGGTNERRLTIISASELESRLASLRTEILRLLEQALAEQRTTRQQSSELVATPPADSAAERTRIDQFARARVQQQKIQTILAGPRDSVVQLTDALRQQTLVNQLDRPELLSQLDVIQQAIGTLVKNPLPVAEQLLTDMRKELEAVAGETPPANRSLAKSGQELETAQREIIETLERLVEQVAEWADADRFLRELARLETLERELAAATAAAAVRQAQAKAQRSELPQEELSRLATQQSEATRRVEKLLESMRQMSGDSSLESEFANRLADAVQQADRNQLTRSMADAARQAEQGQLGRAADAEQSAADQLAELLDLLKNDTPTDPEKLASELRKLQGELAQRQRDLEQSAEKSDRQRQDLADQLNRLARKLERMTASAASQSTQQAASQAAPQQGETEEQKEQQQQQAEQKLAEAQRQLAERLNELEQQRQQRLLERLAVVLEQLIPEQQQVLEETLRLQDSQNEPTAEADKNAFRDVAGKQIDLADQLSRAIADLAARAVFQLSLRGAEGDMRQAATSLGQEDPGHLTQQLELAALARMRHVLDVLREPPPTPDEPQENEGGEGNQGEQGEQQPPIIELAEAKMLRWLQVELNGRTRLYEADLADNPQQKAAKLEVARRLADEQQQLEQLVREMIERRSSPEHKLESL